MKVREKRIRSGKMFEAEFYLISSNGRRYSRGSKKRVSRAVQKRLNDKNARKKLLRLIEANFRAEEDYYCTFTYTDAEMPETYAACKRDVNNFFKRIRRAREKAGLPELKYIYVIEYTVSRRTGKPRFNIHMVINGGLTRKEYKNIWGKGDVKKVEELQEGSNGFEALSKYFVKEWHNERLPETRKRYTPSRNLKQPEIPKPKDGVFKPRFLEKLCKERIDDADYWENRYKGFRFISADAVYNEDYGTWSLAVTMRKRE